MNLLQGRSRRPKSLRQTELLFALTERIADEPLLEGSAAGSGLPLDADGVGRLRAGGWRSMGSEYRHDQALCRGGLQRAIAATVG